MNNEQCKSQVVSLDLNLIDLITKYAYCILKDHNHNETLFIKVAQRLFALFV